MLWYVLKRSQTEKFLCDSKQGREYVSLTTWPRHAKRFASIQDAANYVTTCGLIAAFEIVPYCCYDKESDKKPQPTQIKQLDLNSMF